MADASPSSSSFFDVLLAFSHCAKIRDDGRCHHSSATRVPPTALPPSSQSSSVWDGFGAAIAEGWPTGAPLEPPAVADYVPVNGKSSKSELASAHRQGVQHSPGARFRIRSLKINTTLCRQSSADVVRRPQCQWLLWCVNCGHSPVVDAFQTVIRVIEFVARSVG